MPSTSIQLIYHPTHKPQLGSFIYLLVLTAVISAFLFGYDTGIISAILLYMPKNKHMEPVNSLWKGIIVAATSCASGIACLITGPASDRFGRKKIIVLASLLFMIGGLACGLALNKGTLLIGRVILGFAIGFASVNVPVYISEASPAFIRGILMTSFQAMWAFGTVASNIIAGGFSYINPENIGWRLMFGFAIIPASIQFIGFLFLPESPRHLFKKEDIVGSEEVLNRIYNGDKQWIEYELNEFQIAHQNQNEEKLRHNVGNMVLLRVLQTPHVRKALLIGCSLQFFQNASGSIAVSYYMGTIIKSAGVKSDHATIWLSVLVGSFKLAIIVVPMFLIDRIGRRPLLIVSIFSLVLSLLFMGGSFLLINRNSASIESIDAIDHTQQPYFDDHVSNYRVCAKYKNCDYCVTDDRCGFCAINGQQRRKGFCLPVNTDHSSDFSSTGYCYNKTIQVMGYFCRHPVYIVSPNSLGYQLLAKFSIGFAPLPWVLNAEFYPQWARSTCVSLATFTNWATNVVVSLTYLTLNEAITKYGSFFLYAGITTIGLIVSTIFVPETKGLNIDEVEKLFMGKQPQKKTSSEKESTRV